MLRRIVHALTGGRLGDDTLDMAGEADLAADPAEPSKTVPSMHADTPLEDEAQDRLDRLPFAAGVAEAIARRSDRSSIVLGIYAPWGDGKTTVLNWIRHRLDDPSSDFVVVAFNPWLVRDEITLLPAFFATLATAVGRRLGGRGRDLAGVLKRYGGVLSGVSIGVPGVSVDAGKAAEALGVALADRTLEELKAEFERILREERRRVLVIVDDVDRLDDVEIHVIFKLIKLAAAFEGITYLLAFDDDKVAAALATRYSYTAGTGSGNEGGHDFLEKIVQVPLRLPRARQTALDTIALEGLQAALNDAQIEVEEADVREFGVRYSEGFGAAVNSVRIAKRFANAAGFALPLLKGEANPVDVLTIEGISVCYPTLYAAIRQHPEWFLLPYEFHLSNREEELRTRRREQLDRVLEAIEPSLRAPAKTLVERVFPQTEHLWTNFGSGNQREEWAERQRVCSLDYFDRYFSYAVSTSEVGDRELDEALEYPDRIVERLASHLERKGDRVIEPVLISLSRRIDKLDRVRAEGVIGAVLGWGPHVSRDSTPRFGQLNLQERAAATLAELLLRVPDADERLTIGQRIIDTAQPLPFAAECLRWLRLKKSETDSRRPLDDDAWTQLQARLAERITQFAQQLAQPIWLEDRGVGLMYRARDGGFQASMRDHAKDWLQTDPRLVGALIKDVAGVAYGGSLGMAMQQDLTTDKYESISEIADIEDVRLAVQAVRRGQPPPADFPTLRYDAPPSHVADERLLEQFAWQDARAVSAPGPQLP